MALRPDFTQVTPPDLLAKRRMPCMQCGRLIELGDRTGKVYKWNSGQERASHRGRHGPGEWWCHRCIHQHASEGKLRLSTPRAKRPLLANQAPLFP